MKAKNKAAFVIALVVASLFFNPFIFGRSLKHADLILNCPANQTEAACQTQSLSLIHI